MKQAGRKLMSWLLSIALVLGLFPALGMTAKAADSRDLWVGGVEVTSETNSGTGWNFDAGNNTLTLTGYNNGDAYYTEQNAGVYDSEDDYRIAAGIYYAGTEPLTVVLEGNNTLTMPALSESMVDSAAIFSNGELTFSGSGSLTATGGVNSAAGDLGSYGICSGGRLTFGGSGTLTVSGGNAAHSYGFYGDSVTVTGGTANFTGVDTTGSDSYSIGVYCEYDLTVTGGTVTAKGGAAEESYGFNSVEKGVSVTGGTVTFSGGTSGVSGTITGTIDTSATGVDGPWEAAASAGSAQYVRVTPLSAVASVTSSSGTTTGYADFDDAVAAWKAADGNTTLTLLADVETNTTIAVSGGSVTSSGDTVPITLDLNGYGIRYTGGAKGSVACISGSLRINDSVNKNAPAHYITLNQWRGTSVSTSGPESTVDSDGDGVVKVNGGYITGGTGSSATDENENPFYYGGGLAIINDGYVIMNGGRIIGNTAEVGGGVAIYGNDALFVMNDGSISYNSATDGDEGGGGVYVPYGRFILRGGTISLNTTAGKGGGVDNYGIFLMSGGRIYRNTAETGGGVYNEDDVEKDDLGHFSMSGGWIRYNTAEFSGGGVVNAKEFNISGTVNITDNTAEGVVSNVEGQPITVYDKLDAASRIGVSYNYGVPFTRGLTSEGGISSQSSVKTIFSSDVDGEIRYINGEAVCVKSANNYPEDNSSPMSAFTDLDPTRWYHDGIEYCVENGLMVGVGNHQFNPNGTTSRGMIVAILYRLEDVPENTAENPFSDVKDDQWYTDAVVWAAENKIVGGYGDGKFGPNDGLTREQLVTIFYNYAKYKGVDVSVGESTNILDYEDVESVSRWAVSAMQWAVGSGLVTGRTNTTLNPKETSTRAEIATIMMKYCTEIAK